MLSLIFRSVAVLGAVVALVLYFMVSGQVAEKTEALADSEADLQTAQSELADAQQTMQQRQAELEAVREDLAERRQQFDEVRQTAFKAEQDLSNVRSELTQARQQIEEREQQISTLREEIASIGTATPQPAQQQATGASDEEVREYQNQIARLERQVSELRQELEARPSRAEVAQQQEQKLETGIESTIAGISTNAGVLVLNSGTSAGLVSAREYILKKGDFSVARVRIRDAQPNRAVATILPDVGLPSALRPGDRVTITQ